MFDVYQKFIPLEGNRSHVVQTAWAMMGLIHAGQVSKNNTLNFLEMFVIL